MVGLMLALAGCTVAPAASPAPDSASAGVRPTPAPSAAVACAQARPIGTAFPTAGDVRLGALSFAGLDAMSGPPPGGPNIPGGAGYFYKSGAQLPPDRTVTVSVADSARSYASIATENGSDGGSSTVTYASCPPASGSTGSWWVGGFLLFGRASACVPVQYTDGRDPHTTSRVIVRLGAAHCPATW